MVRAVENEVPRHGANMTDAPNILIAARSDEDLEAVQSHLQGAYENAAACSDMSTLASEFERTQANILLLAFRNPREAERHYLGIYRFSASAGSHPHRTILLCDESKSDEAFERCQEGHYFDYVVFWPHVTDGKRIHLAITRAMREIERIGTDVTSLSEISRRANQLSSVDEDFDAAMTEQDARNDAVRAAISDANENISSAMNNFAQQLEDAAQSGPTGAARTRALLGELRRIQEFEVGQRLSSVAQANEPDWLASQRLLRARARLRESIHSIQVATHRMRRTIVIVDDDPLQLKLLTLLLAEGNFEIRFALSGHEALMVCKREYPDIILLDVNMPDMNGVEVTRQLKTLPSFQRTSIIMMTGQSEREIVEESLAAGAEDFLVKPINKITLFEKLSKCVQKNGHS